MTALRCAAPGTKMWLLNLGSLVADEGFLLRGGGTSTASQPNPKTIRRSLICYCVLFETTDVDGSKVVGMFETGCGNDLKEKWTDVALDCFAPDPETFTEDNTLEAQIEKTGHKISDVKHVILGHLHLDHAGGVHQFAKDTKFYCHEIELKHAFWACSTGCDSGVYLPHYLDPNLDWETFEDKELEIFPGFKLILSPGHSPGLIILEVTLENSGTFYFTSDQYHVSENYELGITQGWLARDHNAWYNSHLMIKRLVKKNKATIVFGHDSPSFFKLKQNPEHYS